MTELPAAVGGTWEEAVSWLRSQPDKAQLVRDAFYDDPLADAAQRYFESGEWRAVREIIGLGQGKTALDIGAGRGIASYALAKDGFAVTALEPDPSALVGAGAIRVLAGAENLSIDVVEEFSETLPFPDGSFDVVFCRAVLHHTKDLVQAIAEMARVLKPGGLLVALREHVISRDEDLPAFLAAHPLHWRYGGEHAFRLDQYVAAIRSSGLHLQQVLTPLRSPVNYWPYDKRSLHREVAAKFDRVPGAAGLVRGLLGLPRIGSLLIGVAERLDHRPGRLYSFVARRG